MAEAKRDENNVAVSTGVLDADGETVTMLEADPTTHVLSAEDNTTGSVVDRLTAGHDENYAPTLIAVSEVDGETPVTLAVDSSGNLLIDSN